MTESWQGALAVIQSLGRKGHVITAVQDGPRSPNSYSDYVGDVIRLPRTKSLDTRARAVISCIRRYGIDLVVPISDRDALTLARAKEIAPDLSALQVSDLKNVRIATDRHLTHGLFQRLGIQTPETWALTPATVFEHMSEFGFPCFVKLSGQRKLPSVNLIRAERQLRALVKRLNKDTLMQIQKPIEGDLVDITGFCKDGKVVESFSFKTPYMYSKAGTPPMAERIVEAELETYLAKIVRALNWTGGIDLDLLRKPDGSFAALEINPRFSGTLVFALKVGVDLPACYFSDDAAKNTPITGAIPSANRFRSVLQHADFRMKNGELTAYEPADQICADSRFPDDTGYSLALDKKLRWIRLLTQFCDIARLIQSPFTGRAKEVTKA